MKSKVPNRNTTIGVRLKAYERKYLEREAEERGQRLSDYVRNILLATINFPGAVGKDNA